MKKPRLTDKVMRGLNVLAYNAPVVDVINNAAELHEIEGYGTKKDVDDALAARKWINNMEAYRKERNKRD